MKLLNEHRTAKCNRTLHRTKIITLTYRKDNENSAGKRTKLGCRMITKIRQEKGQNWAAEDFNCPRKWVCGT